MTVLLLSPVPGQAESIINDKVAHVLIFLVLSFLFDHAYPQYKFLFGLASVLVLYGLLIEVIQGYSGYRTFSWLDFAADALGVSLYFIISNFFYSKVVSQNGS